MIKKLIFFGIIILILISIPLIAFRQEIYLSYMSMKTACGTPMPDNLAVAGTTNFNFTDNSTRIMIYIEDLEGDTLKHELCHKNQIQKNRFFSCKYPILKFFNEIECYFAT